MTKQNRNTGSIGPAGAAAFLLLLAASSALAISAIGENGRPNRGQRRQAMRESQIRVMDIFARNYGGSDWSLVVNDLEAHPADPANATFMSVPLSLANVYLNRYEVGWNKADLERSLGIFEWVAASRELWGGREGSGLVVSYLDIGLARLRAECDVGGFEARIDELWRTALAITAEEADALLGSGRPCGQVHLLSPCVESILPFPGDEEALASRAALFAAASSFLAADPRAGVWAQSARSAAASVTTSACQAAETVISLSQGALSYRLAGGELPDEFDKGIRGIQTGRASPGCSPFTTGYETAGPVDVVSPGDSLAAAIRDSRVVAFYLLERYLWQFPPGSQCDGDEGDDGGIPREPRML
jgi:hypothetical protein